MLVYMCVCGHLVLDQGPTMGYKRALLEFLEGLWFHLALWLLTAGAFFVVFLTL